MEKLISNKVDLKTKRITTNREGHYIIKESFHQEDSHPVYTPNNRVTKHEKPKLTELNGETYKYTVLLEDFTTPLSTTDGTTRQKQQGYRKSQHHQPTGSNQHHKILALTTVKYMFFSSAQGMDTKTDHIPSHKAKPNEFKGT